MKVKIAEPYGFCMGVEKVLKLIKSIKERHPFLPIYCIGQVVHNQTVNNELEKRGIQVLIGDKEENIKQLQSGVVVFSAHGSDQRLIQLAKDKGLIVYDAVCPFVLKEFNIIKNKIKEGYEMIYVGVKNHDETLAALSISPKIHFIETIDDINHLNIESDKILAINQTTLSVYDLKLIYEKLKEKFPKIEICDEICSSTRLRQFSIIENKDDIDGIIVVGDINSNNSKSLAKIAKGLNYDVIMINQLNSLDQKWLNNKKSILIVSGASTPKKLVEEIYRYIKEKK